tara:strand:- start:314 stop:529 length:216 start_codon:yes stop_codon:yes gene_type:complete
MSKAVDHHHQKTIDLMEKEMEKLDDQLDQVDETLGRIFQDLVQPEDQGKIKAIRSHLFAIYADVEELVEKT